MTEQIAEPQAEDGMANVGVGTTDDGRGIYAAPRLMQFESYDSRWMDRPAPVADPSETQAEGGADEEPVFKPRLSALMHEEWAGGKR